MLETSVVRAARADAHAAVAVVKGVLVVSGRAWAGAALDKAPVHAAADGEAVSVAVPAHPGLLHGRPGASTLAAVAVVSAASAVLHVPTAVPAAANGLVEHTVHTLHVEPDACQDMSPAPAGRSSRDLDAKPTATFRLTAANEGPEVPQPFETHGIGPTLGQTPSPRQRHAPIMLHKR